MYSGNGTEGHVQVQRSYGEGWKIQEDEEPDLVQVEERWNGEKNTEGLRYSRRETRTRFPGESRRIVVEDRDGEGK